MRIKSILNRYKEEGGDLDAGQILPAVNASQKNLMLELTKFGSTIENAFEEKAPHKICAYIYEVSNAFNSFYHETKILSEENQAQKESFLKLLGFTKSILETSIELLGFSAPDRMEYVLKTVLFFMDKAVFYKNFRNRKHRMCYNIFCHYSFTGILRCLSNRNKQQKKEAVLSILQDLF